MSSDAAKVQIAAPAVSSKRLSVGSDEWLAAMAAEEAAKDTPVAAAGEKPVHSISLRQWLRLAGIWLCCTLAAGLLPGQAVFASLFADAGVYGQTCKKEDVPCDSQVAMLNMMLGIGMMLSIGLQIPNGILFDLYGGRTVGTMGSSLVVLGLLLETVAIFSAVSGTDQSTNWLVPFAAVITDFGSMLNSYCFFSLIWHYPGSTTMILSLSTATYQVSALLPLALQALMDCTGLHLGWAMLAFALCVLASIPAIWLLTPTQQDYLDQAQEVLGIPLPKPKVSFDICDKLKKGYAAVRMDLRDHCFLCFGFAFSSILASMYNSMSSAYGAHLFHSKEGGRQLADIQVQATATVGALCAPLAAKSADIIGLKAFGYVLILFILVPMALFSIPEWWAAWMTTIGFCLFTTLSQLFQSRYFLHYSPPNRLGVYSGVFTMLIMVIMAPVGMGTYGYISAMPEDDIYQRYTLPYLIFGVIGVASLLTFNIRLHFVHDGRGMPAVPNMLPEDEMELVAPFGAMNLDEAAVIVGLDKEVLFKRLADPDPANFKELMLLVNTDRLQEAFDKHSADDFIKMMEAAPEVEEEEEEPPETSQTPLLSVRDEEAAQAAPAHLASASDELREAFKAGTPESRKKLIEKLVKELVDKERYRALGDCLVIMVKESDADGVKTFMLEVPVEEQWHCFIGMEDWMDEQDSKDFEKRWAKLMPGKQFAALMKQNPQLKDLAARLMKREIQRNMNRFRSKK